MSNHAYALASYLENLYEITGKNSFSEEQYFHIPNYKEAVKELLALGTIQRYINGYIALNL